jgi:hypothetical protein
MERKRLTFVEFMKFATEAHAPSQDAKSVPLAVEIYLEDHHATFFVEKVSYAHDDKGKRLILHANDRDHV